MEAWVFTKGENPFSVTITLNGENIVMWIGEIQATLEIAGKERAALVFQGERGEHYLSFDLQAYGQKPDELVLEPYDFFKLRDTIREVFKKDWEAFMFEIQAGLRKSGFIVDIVGIFESVEGEILKDTDYAKPPRPFDVSQFELPQNILFRSKARLENRDQDLKWSWIGGIVMIVALAAGIFILL